MGSRGDGCPPLPKSKMHAWRPRSGCMRMLTVYGHARGYTHPYLNGSIPSHRIDLLQVTRIHSRRIYFPTRAHGCTYMYCSNSARSTAVTPDPAAGPTRGFPDPVGSAGFRNVPGPGSCAHVCVASPARCSVLALHMTCRGHCARRRTALQRASVVRISARASWWTRARVSVVTVPRWRAESACARPHGG